MITALKLLKNLGKTPAKLNVLIAEEPPAPRPASTVRYSSDIEMIHHEFEVASDKLLEEVNNIIQEADSKNVDKVKRLQALGFTLSSEVRSIRPLIERAEISKTQADLIMSYKRRYPLNKFITEDQVKIICEKYNLVCGNISRYKGFVPETNLRSIEKFKLLPQDDTSPKLGKFYVILNDSSLIDFDDFSKHNIQITKDLSSLKTELKGTDFSFIGKEGAHGRFRSNIEGWGRCFQFKDIDYSVKPTDISKALNRNSQQLMICAPLSDMDMTNASYKDRMLKESIIEIPDPVVLKPVKGGYLIVTAWGDEASDPIVVNEINN